MENLARAMKRQEMNPNSEAVEYLRERSAKECRVERKETNTEGKRTAS